MNKTNIEWTDYTWNPIKGICPMGCWYCYARKMYKRFKWNPEIRYELDDLKIIHDLKGKEHSKIFVCSTFELFHPQVKEEWRDYIFNTIDSHPHHIFQILTKLPQKIDRPMPDNVWLGVTIDTFSQLSIERSWHLKDYEHAKKKFICFEPLLAKPTLRMIYIFDWVIIGRLTQHGHRHDPERKWIEEINEEYGQRCENPIFMKNNLKEIWGKPLIQEFPK